MMASRVPPATRTPVPPLKRRRLSRRDFAELILRQEGRCACCAERLTADRIVDEHVVPLDLGGGNDLSNRALFCSGCARIKTANDVARSAHGRRVRGETGQKKRQARRRAGLLRQRSFQTNRDMPWKRKMTGEIVRRPPRRKK